MSGMTHKKIYFNINKRITLFCVPLSLLSLSVCLCVCERFVWDGKLFRQPQPNPCHKNIRRSTSLELLPRRKPQKGGRQNLGCSRVVIFSDFGDSDSPPVPVSKARVSGLSTFLVFRISRFWRFFLHPFSCSPHCYLVSTNGIYLNKVLLEGTLQIQNWPIRMKRNVVLPSATLLTCLTPSIFPVFS